MKGGSMTWCTGDNEEGKVARVWVERIGLRPIND